MYLDGVQIPLCVEQFLGERTYPGMPDDTAVSCAKVTKPIEMPFALWTRLGRRKHMLYGRAHWRNLVNTTEPSVCGGDAASVKLL